MKGLNNMKATDFRRFSRVLDFQNRKKRYKDIKNKELV